MVELKLLYKYDTYTHFGSGDPQSAQLLLPDWCKKLSSLSGRPDKWMIEVTKKENDYSKPCKWYIWERPTDHHCFWKHMIATRVNLPVTRLPSKRATDSVKKVST